MCRAKGKYETVTPCERFLHPWEFQSKFNDTNILISAVIHQLTPKNSFFLDTVSLTQSWFSELGICYYGRDSTSSKNISKTLGELACCHNVESSADEQTPSSKAISSRPLGGREDKKSTRKSRLSGANLRYKKLESQGEFVFVHVVSQMSSVLSKLQKNSMRLTPAALVCIFPNREVLQVSRIIRPP